MSITLVGSPQTTTGSPDGSTGNVGTLTVSGAVGDVVVVFWYQRTNASGAPTPGGDITLTEISTSPSLDGNGSHGCWYGVLDSASVDVTVTGQVASGYTWVMGAVVLRGVDTTTPMDTTPVSGRATPSTPFDVTLTGVTTATNGAWHVVALGSRDNNTLAVQTSGYDTRWAVEETLGSDASSILATKEIATAGGTGDVVIRQTTLGGDETRWVSFALRPGGSAPSGFVGWGVPI